MSNIAYEVKVAIWVVVALIISISLIFLFFGKYIKNAFAKKNPIRFFYHRVLSVVRDYDLYLVNNFEISDKNGVKCHFDHIIAGDKFIYLIIDRYYEGTVGAVPKSPTWAYYRKDGAKELIPNPLNECKLAMSKLSVVTGMNTSFMIGIVLINNDCVITPIKNVTGEPLLLPSSSLKELVGKYEKSNVDPFNPTQLKQIVKDLHDLNENKASI